jgi:amino acid transporter
VWFKDLGPIDTQGLVDKGVLSEEALKQQAGTATLSLILLLRAFSSGAVALSGVEAVSNGVPAFRKPESKNAAKTLTAMGIILGTGFLGISILASHLKPFRGEEDPTGIALMARHVYGGTGVLFWITQISTFAILILAANTAYADFPRLASIIGRDGFLPRQFSNRGDRLVFSNGVIFLAVVASILIVIFGGVVTKLIPLYAFGVFTGFTLSQAGMVKHHLKHKEKNWQASLVINAIGSFTTGVIALIVVGSKFKQGAWLPAIIIPSLVVLFLAIKRHYARLGAALRIDESHRVETRTNTMIVLVGGIHIGVITGLEYAKSLNPEHIQAVHFASSEDDVADVRARWALHEIDVPLDIVVDEYRNLTSSVIKYVDEVDERWANDRITVVIPEFVVKRWWEHLLHNQAALFLKGKLLFKENVVVVSVPYQVETRHVTHIDRDAPSAPKAVEPAAPEAQPISE